MEKKKLKKLIVKNSIIGTVILVLAIIALTLGLSYKEGKIQQLSLGNTNKNNVSEVVDTYSVYMLLDQVNIEDDTNLSGNKVKVSTNEEDLDISFFNVLTNENIQVDENGSIEVPQEGIKLRVDGIKAETSYEINVENIEQIQGKASTLKSAIISIEATAEGEIVAFVKNITKIVNGQEVTINGSEEKTAVFMYEDENNKIKIKGNKDVEIYYIFADKNGLTEQELENATWNLYTHEEGLKVEKNGIIYAKSRYKTGNYSEINQININNIDKLTPNIEVIATNINEDKSEASVTLKLSDKEETKDYSKSGIYGYAITATEVEPSEFVPCEENEAGIEINGISENGNYYAWVQDKAGNSTHVEVKIKGIEELQDGIVAVVLDAPVEILKGTEYNTLQELVQTLETNGITKDSGTVIVQMVNDVKNKTVEIENKNIILDLNGYTISSKLHNPTIRLTNASLNIVDNKYNIEDYIDITNLSGTYTSKVDEEGNQCNGKINSLDYIAIEVLDEGILSLGENSSINEIPNIETPTIEGGLKGVWNKGGIFNFYDGQIISKLPVEGKIIDKPVLYDPTVIRDEETGKFKSILQKVAGIEAVIGNTRYTKLENAITSASVGDKIDIVTDITKDVTLEIDNTKEIIIDLNGYTITNTIRNYIFVNNGKLEIVDSEYDENDEEKNGIIINTSYGGVIHNTANAELKITSGVIKSTYRTSNIGIIQNEGTFCMDGGNITTGGNGAECLIKNQKTVTIKGGILNSSTSQGIWNIGEGTVTIEGGIINTALYAIWVVSNCTGTVEVKGGTITSESNVIYNYGNANNIIVKGGTISSKRGTVIESTYTNTNIIVEGGTISSEQGNGIKGGNITIKGGTISSGTGYSIYAIWNSSAVTNVIVEKGTINGNNAIYNEYNGDITIKGGTIESSEKGIYNKGTGKIIIEGGTIKSTSNNAITNDAAGSIILKRGNLTGQCGINNWGTGTIILGDNDGQIDSSSINIKGQYGIRNLEGTLKFYDGTITGELDAIYGVVNDIEEGHDITLTNTEEGEVATLERQENVAYVGEDISNLYSNLQSAIDAVEEGETITLIKDISLVKPINILENKKLTINLNDKKISTYVVSTAIINNGELIIDDRTENAGGKICGYTQTIINNGQSGKLIIHKGKLESTYEKTGAQCIKNKGNITIDEITINVKSGTTTYGIYNEGEGNITITGGSVYKIKNADSGIITLIGGIADTIENGSSGTIIINGGTVKTSGEANKHGITNSDEGNITVERGNISAVGTNSYGIYSTSSNDITIKSGTIYGNAGGISNSGLGNVTVTGGNVGKIINSSSGNLTVDGGTIGGITNSSSGTVIVKKGQIINSGIYNSNEAGTVILGEKDGKADTTLLEVSGEYGGGVNNKGTFKFYDGIIKAREGTSIVGNVTEWEDACNIIKYKQGENENYTVEKGYEIAILEKQDIVHVQSTDRNYTTLEEAISNSSETDTLTLLLGSMTNNPIQIDENKNITLDLNGCNLTINQDGQITNNGTLDITDTVGSGSITSSEAILNNKNANLTIKAQCTTNIQNEGKLIIEGKGTASTINNLGNLTMNGGIVSKISNLSGGIATVAATSGQMNNIENSGMLTISGGRFLNIYNIESGEILIEGGTIDLVSNSSSENITVNEGKIKELKNTDLGNITIVGGTITGIKNTGSGNIKTTGGTMSYIANGSSGSIVVEGGTINSYITNLGDATVTGGTIASITNSGNINILKGNINYSTGNAITNNSTGTVILGEKDGKIDKSSLNIKGNKGIVNSGVLKFYDGTVTGKIEAIEGTISDIEDANELIVTKTEEGKVVTIGNEGIAYIGEDTNNLYNNLQSAIDAVETEETITLIKDIAISKSINIAENKKISININGNEVTCYVPEEEAIINNGELTITDTSENAEGKIYGYTQKIIFNEGTGTVTVEGGTISIISESSYAIYNEGTVTVTGGTISNTSSYAIYNEGTITVEGGTIVTKGGYSSSRKYAGTILNNKGTIRMTGGKIESSFSYNYSQNKLRLFCINNTEGTVTIEGGAISAAEEAIYNSYVSTETKIGTVTVTGGTITSTNTGIIGGNITVTGGEIEGGIDANDITVKNGTISGNIGIRGNTIIVTGGTITSTNTGIIGGNITVTGGEITGDQYGIYGETSVTLGEDDKNVPSTEIPKITGGTYGITCSNNGVVVNIYDGKIIGGELAITGGQEIKTPEGYVVKYKENATIAILERTGDFDNAILVGETYCDSLSSAIDMISATTNKTGTIHICSDLLNISEGITISEGANITIALEGHKIVYNGVEVAIINNGTLNIVDFENIADGTQSTTSTLKNETGILVQNNGNLFVGKTENANPSSPKLEGTQAVEGNQPTINSGTVTNTVLQTNLMSSRTINESVNTALSTTPVLETNNIEWTNIDVEIIATSDVIPILDLYSGEEQDYTIEYYYDNEINTQDTKQFKGIIGKTIDDYPQTERNGYKLERTENLPLTLTKDGENVIKVYYVKNKTIVTKVDSETKAALPNAKFMITSADGDYVIDKEGNYFENDKQLTFTSTTTYPWTQNEDGTWQSGNSGRTGSSTLVSEEFKIEGTKTLSFDWSVCSAGLYYGNLYYMVTDSKTDSIVINGNNSSIYGIANGTTYDNLKYNTINLTLTEGTYKIKFDYYKAYSSSYGAPLDKGYVKNVKLKTNFEDKYITTDENGKYEINLNEGDYKLIEMVAPTGYDLPSNEIDRTYSFTVGTSENELEIPNNKIYEYTVEHYINGELDESSTETLTAKYGDVINTISGKPKSYVYGTLKQEKVENLPLEISLESNKTIKVYWSLYKLVINTVDSSTGEGLQGVKYAISDTSGRYTIDDKGRYNENIVDLTFTSEGDYPWTQNEDGIWQSGNENIDHSVSTLKSEEFTIKNYGASLTIEWARSGETRNYLYYNIINKDTGVTSGGGTYYPSSSASETLSYSKYEQSYISPGTYVIEVKYENSYSSNGTENDTAYLKSMKLSRKEPIESLMKVSDENGKIEISVAQYGYTITQIEAPEYYKLANPVSTTIDVGYGKDVTEVTFENEDISTKYTVEYYYNGEKDEEKTEELKGISGEEVTEYPDKSMGQYILDSVDTLPLVISENESENIIKVYYTRPNNLSYTVNYLNEDGEEIHEPEVVENQEYGKVITAKEIAIEIEGHTYDESKEQETLTIGTDTSKNIINIYYIKRSDLKYTINYLEKDTNEIIHEAKVVEEGVYGGKITAETEKIEIPGYTNAVADKEEITIGINEEENVINIYYEKRTDIPYKVEYYYNGEKDESKTVNNTATYLSIIDSYEDKILEGYVLVEEKGIPLTITAEEEKNVIKVYYAKKAQVTIKYLNQKTNEVLEEKTEEGYVGKEIQLESKDFANYVLVEEPENKKVTMTEEEIIVRYYFVHVSKGVIEKHIDKDTGEILYNTVHEGKEGDAYKTEAREIEGYDIIEEEIPENSEGEMEKEAITVTYYYKKKEKVTITVKYIDKETKEEIGEEQKIEGYEGKEYKTEKKDISGYEFVETSGQTEGTMTVNAEIKYYYQKVKVPSQDANTPGNDNSSEIIDSTTTNGRIPNAGMSKQAIAATIFVVMIVVTAILIAFGIRVTIIYKKYKR